MPDSPDALCSARMLFGEESAWTPPSGNALASKGKRLFIQLQDASFTPSIFCVPEYLMQDPQFNGGADKQYNIVGDDEEHAERRQDHLSEASAVPYR